MSRRTAVVVAGSLGLFLGGRLFAEQQKRPSDADRPTDASRTVMGVSNDDCENRIPIFEGDTDYDTTGATTDGMQHHSHDGGPVCQFDGQTYHDIWYNYEATCAGNLTVSTCDQAEYDTDLVVYDGCFPDIPCPPGEEHFLECNDDFPGCAGFTSQVTVRVVPGNCYKIRVGGWNDGDMGTGTVTLTLICLDGCGDGVCAPGENECNCAQDCPGACPCTIFNNQAEFEAFNQEEGKILKGIEDFEGSTLPPESVAGLDDPLCGGIPSAPPGTPYPVGLTQLSMCVQSNTLGGAPSVPSPSDGLAAASAGYLGGVSDVVRSNTFIISWDLMLISPPVLPGEEDDHTGVGFNTLTVLGGSTVDIRVYNKGNALLASDISPADPAGSNFWGVCCADPIGRINIFDPASGSEGADNIQLWLAAEGDPCGDCPTDMDGDGDTGPFDLAFLLGFWGPCEPGEECACLDADDDGLLGPADLAVLLGAWGLCP